MYSVRVSLNNVIDLEKPLTEDVGNAFIEATPDYDAGFKSVVRQAVSEKGATGESVWASIVGAVRDEADDRNMPANEFIEFFKDIESGLRSAGYDGFTHIGGLRAGRGKRLHRVVIVFDPSNVLGVVGENPLRKTIRQPPQEKQPDLFPGRGDLPGQLDLLEDQPQEIDLVDLEPSLVEPGEQLPPGSTTNKSTLEKEQTPEEEQKEFDPGRDQFYQDKLIEALSFRKEGYYKGLTGIVDEDIAGKDSFKFQLDLYGEGDNEHLTFSNVFINNNYPRFLSEIVPELQKRPVVFIVNEAADITKLGFEVIKDFRIGNNCIINKYSYVAAFHSISLGK